MGFNDRIDHPESYGAQYARDGVLASLPPIVDRDPGDETDATFDDQAWQNWARRELPDGIQSHVVKTWPDYFQASRKRMKMFEVRLNDRDYRAGDLFVSREYRIETGFTGEEDHYKITYVLGGDEAERFGLRPGYVGLGLAAIEQSKDVRHAASLLGVLGRARPPKRKPTPLPDPGAIRYDQHGPMRVMAAAEGYVMACRKRCIPFAIKVEEWNKFSTEPLQERRTR